MKGTKENPNKNYPKNTFIYAMGLTNHALLGVRQKLKRSRIKLARNRKSEDIKTNLKTLEDKLKVTSDDKPRRRSLKLIVSQEIEEAKKAQLEKDRKSLG